VVISHDRHFLDQTVDVIYEIRDRTLVRYGGNYSYYIQARSEQDEQQLRSYKRQQRFIRKTEDFIRKNMAGQKVSQAKSRLKMLDRLERLDRPSPITYTNGASRATAAAGNDVFPLRQASGHWRASLARNVDEGVFYQDRGHIGRKGCGSRPRCVGIMVL
jgi:ATP-binding cassette subfamily F protein 3